MSVGLALALAVVAGVACTATLATPADDIDGGATARDAGEPSPRDSGREVRDADEEDAGTTVAAPIRVAVVSDLNGSYGSTTYDGTVTRAVARVVALAPDVVLSTGDMVAGQRAGLDYRAMWRGFHAAVTDPLAGAGLPFAVTPGNHDASGYASSAEERAIFVDEWSGPRRPSLDFVDDSNYPLRYSFRVGPALFVSLDDTTIGPLGAAQMEWLAGQLATDAPVKVVFGHIPLYPFAQGRETEVIGDASLERLLVEHEVDLFVSGHHHAYYPGRRGPLRLVSTACVGAGPRALIGVSSPSVRSVLVFDITDEGIVELDAWAGETYDELIERTSLPPSVGSGETAIVRDDL
jgi:3',5'-cyclic AMP phosphodiesterase CpdA